MASRTPGKPPITQRQRLGLRLRALRELAGLTGDQIAAELGVSAATVSRIEGGDRLIRLPEIDKWVRATDAPPETRTELAALAEAAQVQITPWRSGLYDGLDQAQVEIAELEASAATIHVYDHYLVHGLLQVREYARLVFEMAAVDEGQIEPKVEGRIRRQPVLFDQSKRFTILMTEAGLWWQPGSAELQLQQLERIAAVTRLPNVRVGLLPLRGQARAIYPENFHIYTDRADDADTLVRVELIPDEITISAPDEVALYLREFERLSSSAVYDDDARAILARISEELRRA
jgi:transcriptional regulator with XRE-family HTH domain